MPGGAAVQRSTVGKAQNAVSTCKFPGSAHGAEHHAFKHTAGVTLRPTASRSVNVKGPPPSPNATTALAADHAAAQHIKHNQKQLHHNRRSLQTMLSCHGHKTQHKRPQSAAGLLTLVRSRRWLQHHGSTAHSALRSRGLLGVGAHWQHGLCPDVALACSKHAAGRSSISQTNSTKCACRIM
jgi:hypothetical protein